GLGRMKAVLRSWRPDMRADWEAFARALPEGARVAAPWAATEAFVFWAPHATYLDVLDPIFIAAKDAATYRLYLDLFEGRVADSVAFARLEEVDRPTRLALEVSSYGTAQVFVDDRLAAAILSPRAGVLGRGVIVTLALDSGRHRLTIHTCPAEGQLGFYALV